MRYKVAFQEKDIPKGCALAEVEEKVVVRGEHFAIRQVFTPHPAGENIWQEAYILDHMPSGKRVFGSDNMTFAESFGACSAFAESLGSTPVDWSAKNPDTEIEGLRRFIGFAREAASVDEASINWAEWAEAQ